MAKRSAQRKPRPRYQPPPRQRRPDPRRTWALILIVVLILAMMGSALTLEFAGS